MMSTFMAVIAPLAAQVEFPQLPTRIEASPDTKEVHLDINFGGEPIQTFTAFADQFDTAFTPKDEYRHMSKLVTNMYVAEFKVLDISLRITAHVDLTPAS